MLLRHTTKEIGERSALTVNPAKTCQPVGAMYAALGVHGCLPHSHGSQGCCSYHRSALTRHYKEPVMASTSSFTEGSSVFGGQANLIAALETIFSTYKPEGVAIHTTCLSETIGDDISQIVSKARDEGKVPAGAWVAYCNTPSYVGSHVTGFANMVTGFVKQFAKSTGTKNGKLAVLPGWVEPGDYREIRSLLRQMGIQATVLPDTSEVLDGPLTGEFQMYPKGGTKIEDIVGMGDALALLACGRFSSADAANALDSSCKVRPHLLDIPLGIRATDRFVQTAARAAGVAVPAEVMADRGRVVDVISDMQQYFYRKKVALVGDPDQLVPLTEFLLDLGMLPTHIVTGTPGKAFDERMLALVPGANVKSGQQADMYLLHQWIKNDPVDLIIGNTYCKYIARDEDIPYVRMGFPILDRVGHSYFPTVGYNGALRLLEKLLNVLLDRKDRDSPETSFELVL